MNHVKDCKSDADKVKDQFEDLFYKHKVDIVISAHTHLYERKFPIYNENIQNCEVMDTNSCIKAKAPIFIVTGVPGNPESYAYGAKTWQPFTAFQSSHLSFGKLKIVNETYLAWEQVLSDTYEVIDYLHLYK